MNTTTRRAVTTIAAASALALTAPLQAQAHSDDTAYVGMGDSFSAGVGTNSPTDACYRSPLGYPVLLAAREGWDLDYQACGGATTSDVAANQVGTLSDETDHVTMTIGGNDVGFSLVIGECARPGWISDCEGAVSQARTVLYTEMPGRYDSLFTTIGEQAPNADVVIGGYPRLFKNKDRNAFTFFTRAETTNINNATDELDHMIHTTSTDAGFEYVDPRAAFRRHAVGARSEWINGLTFPFVESFHPNRAGNEAYANVFATALDTSASDGDPRSADSGASPLSEDPRVLVQSVLAMQLASPANLEKAEAAGIKASTIQGLTQDLISNDSKKITKAMQKLQRLDRRYEWKQKFSS